MNLEEQVKAVRYRTVLTEVDHVTALRISGPDAYDALERICPRELFIRDSQVVQSLLLRDDGRPFADIYLACDDEDFILLSEGPERSLLADYLGTHIPADLEVAVDHVRSTHCLFSLDGPWAWELLAARFGPDVMGMPYLTLFETEVGHCVRAGKTGEYGYTLFVPRTDRDAFKAEMLEIGRAFDLVEGSREALDLCALENWFFNIRGEGKADVTPLELQLQWRISPRKRFVGSDAIEARRKTQCSRATTVRAAEPIAVNDPVLYRGRPVGAVLNAGYSYCRGEFLGLALLDLAVAHSGLDCLCVDRDGVSVSVTTASPPLLNNRSLHVDPQQHCYEYRHDFDFPPIT